MISYGPSIEQFLPDWQSPVVASGFPSTPSCLLASHSGLVAFGSACVLVDAICESLADPSSGLHFWSFSVYGYDRCTAGACAAGGALPESPQNHDESELA